MNLSRQFDLGSMRMALAPMILLLATISVSAQEYPSGLLVARVTVDEDGAHQGPVPYLDLRFRGRLRGVAVQQRMIAVSEPLARSAVFIAELPAGPYEIDEIYLRPGGEFTGTDFRESFEGIEVELPEVQVYDGQVTYLGSIIYRGAPVFGGSLSLSYETSPNDSAFRGWIERWAPQFSAYEGAVVRHWGEEPDDDIAPILEIAQSQRLNRTTEWEHLSSGGAIAGNAHGYLYIYSKDGDWETVQVDPSFGLLALRAPDEDHWIAAAEAGRVWSTVDRGQNWDSIDLGIDGATVHDFALTSAGDRMMLTADGYEVRVWIREQGGLRDIVTLSAEPPELELLTPKHQNWRPQFVTEGGTIGGRVTVILSARHAAVVSVPDGAFTEIQFPGNVLDVWVEGTEIHCRCRGRRYFSHWMTPDHGATWVKP
jgi:hypothetical protein